MTHAFEIYTDIVDCNREADRASAYFRAHDIQRLERERSSLDKATSMYICVISSKSCYACVHHVK